MSVLAPTPHITSTQHPAVKALRYRDQRYIKARLAGKTVVESLAIAGLPAWLRTRELKEVEDLVVECALLAEKHAVECGLVDAIELHEFLTDAIRAQRSDIQNDDLSYKPMSEWPAIWQQMAEDGYVDIRYESQRSHDGKTEDLPGGWDKTGRRIESVSFKFGAKAKWVELAMKHKAVDAMVQQGDKLGAGLSDLAGAINQRLTRALERESKMIDVTPAPVVLDVVADSEKPT